MISYGNRIQRNTIYFFITTFVRFLTNTFLFIIIARNYGPDIYGTFTSAHTLATLFMYLGDFGFDLLMVTEIARDKDNSEKIFNKYYPIKIIFSIISLILLLCVGLYFTDSYVYKVIILILSFNMFFTTMSNLLFAFFRGIHEFIIETKISVITNLCLLISITYFAAINSSIFVLAIIIVLLRVLSFALSYKIINKFIKTKLVFIKISSSEFKKVLIYGLHLLFGTIYFQIDTILLMALKNNYEVGLYQAVFKLVVVFLVIPDILINVTLPIMTNLFEKKDAKWQELGKFLFKLLFFISLPITFILYNYSSEIIILVYKKEFINSVPILRIFAIILFFRYVGEVFAMTLTVKNNQLVRTIFVIVASFINIIFNLIFIPKYGILAASLISLATNIIIAMAYIISLSKYFILCVKDYRLIFPIIYVIISSFVIVNINSIPYYISITMFLFIYTIISLKYGLSSIERNYLLNLKQYSA